MTRHATGLLLCAFLWGCGGGDAPFGQGTDGGSGSGDGDGGGIVREGLPPGTSSPTPNASLFRTEPTEAEGGKLGDGYATDVSYDGTTDTFMVDNLAFDGGNVYQRGQLVSSLNGGTFNVYEADRLYPDALTTDPINQLTHRAIYGVSRNLDANGKPQTQFAIVRTGSYIGYGFGGFIYQRENDVELPASGQATFSGRSAGLRDRDGVGGLEYSTADVTIDIDFEDFNDVTGGRGDGVKGRFFNRKVYGLDGSDNTAAVVSAINANNNASLQEIPDVLFKIGPGVLDNNGDLVGDIFSNYVDNSGRVQEYETGKYYAIVSGKNPDEIVGVMVLENTAEADSVTVRDTSGFIVYRGAGN